MAMVSLKKAQTMNVSAQHAAAVVSYPMMMKNMKKR